MRRARILALTLIAVAGAAFARGGDMPVELSPADAAADLRLARKAYETMHPGYDRYTSRDVLDASWDALTERAAEGMTRGDLYLELSRTLALIRCDHTKAELPRDAEQRRREEPVYLPFSFRLFDGRMYVDKAVAGTGLERGDEVLAIDGVSIGDYVNALNPLLPVDGDTDHVKPRLIDSPGEFMGPGLEHFAPYLFSIEPVARVGVRNGGGDRVRVMERIDFDAYESLIGQKRYSQNFVDAVRIEMLGERGAYLAVDTFVNYRQPVDAVAHLAPYFEQLEQEGRDRLVLDLRRNGGGSDDAQTALLRHLIDAPLRQADAKLTRFTSIDPELKAHIRTWDAAALNPDPAWFRSAGDGFYEIIEPAAGAAPGPITPAEHAFDGEIVLLTSSSNASGLTHLIANLKTAGVATFVGEKTGGAPTGATAGIIYFLELPGSGIRLRVPAQRTVIANAGGLPARDGIEPDVYAPETVESWLNGRDPALEAALERLGLEAP